MVALFILIPLISLMLINLLPRRLMNKFIFWWGAFLSLLQIWLALSPASRFWSWRLMYFKFDLAADNLSLLLLLSSGLVMFITYLAAEYLIADANRKFNFLNLLLVLQAGMNGIVLVKDIFSLYVFLEITAVASFIIIALKKEKDGYEGAFKYIVFSSVATVMMLTAIALIILVSGDTSFAAIAAALKTAAHQHIILLAIGLYLSALFIKGGLMPFHGWLPDAYTASTSSVSIILAGIVTKTVGIYPLIRIVHSVFGFDHPIKNVLLLFGAISVVFGALSALGQSNFKRLLAYSSISQVGYIFLG
ncbi:MAG: proton-conducting transporter membrane subunit, partial [Candidatus Margulisbacteria bacterium]|nr:proton-conducting transporter membrane subunit [Candidatus Margulisiibacteriota bacterium]